MYRIFIQKYHLYVPTSKNGNAINILSKNKLVKKVKIKITLYNKKMDLKERKIFFKLEY